MVLDEPDDDEPDPGDFYANLKLDHCEDWDANDAEEPDDETDGEA
jgi:hypothetical protein